jgi:threonine dehydratase
MTQAAVAHGQGVALRGDPLPARDPISGLTLPTLHDVYLARRVVARYLPPTPLLRPEGLAARLGCDIYVKCENMQPIGAFKVRGGLNLLSHLSPAERARGVVAASTGNHGQSIAYAAREFGCEARIYMPERANPLKVASMQRLGARVVFAGADFDEALAAAQEAAASGAYFIHSANEPFLIAGVATCTLEILEAVPDLDGLIVPAGGGSGLAGACLAGKEIDPDLRVIGVQSEGAPAMRESWRAGDFVTTERVDTYAEGLATRAAWSLPMQILWRRLDDFLLVSDAELRRSTLTLLETTRQLAEGAGAAALAAAWRLRDDLAGRKVAVVLSGGNLTLDALAQALAEERPW